MGTDWTNKTFCLNIRKLFYHKGGQILERFAQGGCGVSTLGDIKKPTGPGPGHPAPADPA